MKQNPPSFLKIGAPLSGEPRPGLQWIEVASFLQIPGFQVIGLPGPEVAEARERIRAAITASQLEFPRRKIILNLSPASIRKRGTGADLAMALAVLQESYGEGAPPIPELLPNHDETRSTGSHDTTVPQPPSVVAWGELGLDGKLKATGQMTFALYAAWEAGADALLVAADEYGLAQEKLAVLRMSGIIPGGHPPRVLPARNLAEAWNLLQSLSDSLKAPGGVGTETLDTAWIPPSETFSHNSVTHSQLMPLSKPLERVLGVAASGSHHLMVLGPRGTGKSHALEWLIALQPEPSASTRVQRALIEELCGIPAHANSVRRISSHVKPQALIGSANPAGVRPGEFSLAHGGLLLADEFPEWARDARESLREPLERGRVTLTRTRQSVELPARFILAANGNLCPCGGWPPELPLPTPGGSDRKIARCVCSVRGRSQYLSRLSGPVLDRLDLLVMTAQAGASETRKAQADGDPNDKKDEEKTQSRSDENPQELSSQARLRLLREQVLSTRARLLAQWGELPALLSGADLERILAAHPEWAESLHPSRFASLRHRHKTLRVALTLAAWDGAAGPSGATFVEASCYRPERFGLNA